MAASKWKSVYEALPGINQSVFVYCEKSKKVMGPAYIAEHKSVESQQITGYRSDSTTDGWQEIHEGTGIFPLRWSMNGHILQSFMPTHWTEFPELPEMEGPRV